MALTDLFKRFDKCMSDPRSVTHEGCAGCPLLKEVRLTIGEDHDEHGGITWKIQACSVMAILDKALSKKTTAAKTIEAKL